MKAKRKAGSRELETIEGVWEQVYAAPGKPLSMWVGPVAAKAFGIRPGWHRVGIKSKKKIKNQGKGAEGGGRGRKREAKK